MSRPFEEIELNLATGREHGCLSELGQAALSYASLGIRVYPVQPNGKRPISEHGYNDGTTDHNQILEWWSSEPDANVGFATGSQFEVLDVDGDIGKQSMFELFGPDWFQRFATVVTGSGGVHCYFAATGLGSPVGFLPGLDWRGTISGVVAPPSIHETGVRYTWVNGTPSAFPAPPQVLLDAVRRPLRSTDAKGARLLPPKGVPLDADSLADVLDRVRSAPEHTRNDTLNRNAFAVLQRADEHEAEVITELLEDAALASGLLTNEIQKTLNSARVGAAKKPSPRPLTDLGNAERLIDQYGENLRFNTNSERWLIWDGCVWRVDLNGEIDRLARKVVRTIYQESMNPWGNDDIVKWAKASESKNHLGAMIQVAQKQFGVPVSVDDLDNDPWLVTAKNGTIDLRTGQLLPFDRTHLITKQLHVEYDPSATCPNFDTFLRKIMPDDEVVTYLQTAAGYSLTGLNKEQCVFFLYGGGANGKTTFVNAIAHVLGPHGWQAPTSLLVDRRDGIPNDLARLAGVRYVMVTEPEDRSRLNEAIVKSITGGDRVSARFLHKEFFEFVPACKIWLSTNHKPLISGVDHGIWRRIRLIPFLVAIPDDEQDKKLGAKLELEAPGILNWMVKGCLAWQANGLRVPLSIKMATDDYRSEMDILGNFLTDVCVEGDDLRVTKDQLFREYEIWCQANGEKPSSKRQLGYRLKERGLEEYRTSSDRGWSGISVSPEWRKHHGYNFSRVS